MGRQSSSTTCTRRADRATRLAWSSDGGPEGHTTEGDCCGDPWAGHVGRTTWSTARNCSRRRRASSSAKAPGRSVLPMGSASATVHDPAREIMANGVNIAASPGGGRLLAGFQPAGEIRSDETVHRGAQTTSREPDKHALVQLAAVERGSNEPIDSAKRRRPFDPAQAVRECSSLIRPEPGRRYRGRAKHEAFELPEPACK